MIFDLYAIKDEVSDTFMAPVPFMEKRSKEVAQRWFQQNMTDKEQPADYSLWKIGQYNADTGRIEGEENIHLIMRGE